MSIHSAVLSVALLGMANVRLTMIFCTNGIYYEVAQSQNKEWITVWSKDLPLDGKPSAHVNAIHEANQIASALIVEDDT